MSPTSPSPLRRLASSYSARLLTAMLATCVPLAVVVALVLQHNATESLEGFSQDRAAAAAKKGAGMVDEWVDDRKVDVAILALQLTGDPATDERLLDARRRTEPDTFQSIAVVTPAGRTVLRSGGAPLRLDGKEWFREAVLGRAVVSQLEVDGGEVGWYAAQAVRGGRRVVVARLEPSALDRLLGPVPFGQRGEALIVDGRRRLVASTSTGAGTPRSILAGNPEGQELEGLGVSRAAAGESGDARYTDFRGEEVLGGFYPVETTGWGLVVKQPVEEAFAAVYDGERLALLLVLLGTGVIVGVSLLTSRVATRPVRELSAAADRVTAGDLDARVAPTGARELRELGAAFNAMVASVQGLTQGVRAAGGSVTNAAQDLASASEELSATSAQQTTSATETSATMEELARTSGSIADNVEAVARQAGETRDALLEAQEDIRASSERTVALARQVEEIDGILVLINDIADKTSLLALNAAIEAERAGESGRGFTVVAEEVRRLAESSKDSASRIAGIVSGTKAETTATVMAMETGAKQMTRGLELMESVAIATSQVQLTTEQQRAATRQVVEVMEQIASAVRNTSATAVQVAEASSDLVGLASNLEDVAAATAPADAPGGARTA